MIIDRLIEAIKYVFYAALSVLMFVIYGSGFVLVLLMPYFIWSGIFSCLPDKPLKFALFAIPALVVTLFIIWGTVSNDESSGSSKKGIKKRLTGGFWKAIVIIALLAEIVVAYIYPAPMIDDRGYRFGGGYSSGYGSSNSSNHSSDSKPFWDSWHNESNGSSGWESFEKKNRIGDTYKDISEENPNMIEAGNSGGGVLLQANNSLYFSFPKMTKSDISDMDVCTGMTGTAEEFFGFDEVITVDEFKQKLGLTSETEYDGNLNYKKTSSSGYYYVVVLDVDIVSGSDLVKPDTWISVIQRNRETIPVGRRALDQNATETTVYYVDDGDRYHKDVSCSTLHDSDTIYECYIDDIPDGRTPCGVCY